MTQDAELDLFSDLHAKYSELLGHFEEDDKYIRGDFESAGIIPDDSNDPGLKLTKPSSVYDAVENASDHILSFPRITVAPRPVSSGIETATAIAERKQRFLQTWWERVFTDQGDPLGQAKKSLIKGKCVLKKEIRWELLPALPESPTAAEKRRFREVLQKVSRSRFLWSLRVVPKETVFEDPERPHDPAFVFESYTVAAHEAKRRWPHLATTLAGTAPLERVRYLEYWSKPEGQNRGRFIQWIEDERVHEGWNPYSWETPLSTVDEPDYDGYIPYAIGDPGWGDVGPEAKPEDRYVSIVRPMRSMALADCRFLTEMEAYLRLYIWKVLVTQGYPADAQFKLGPGAHWSKTEDQTIELLQFGEMPVSLLQGMTRVRQYMDEHSKFGTLGGIPQTGVDTATEAAQNVQNASSKLAGPVRTLKRLATRLDEWVLADVEKVLEVPVTLYGSPRVGPAEVTLSPRDISGYWFTNVELETSEEAQLSMRVARVFADLYQRVPVSAEGVLQKAGYDDPRGEMDRRMLEDLERSPQATQVMLLAMLTGLAGTVSPAETVRQAFAASLARLTAPATPGGMAPQDDMPANPVEAMRTETRDEAIANQPDLSMS